MHDYYDIEVKWARRAAICTLVLMIAFATIVALAYTAFAADTSTPNYSDGVTFNTEADWGAPSNLHLDEQGQACIDPPYWIWLTLHVKVNGVESADLTQVFPYEHNTPGYVCVPFPLPECPDETQDLTWAAYGTWNIGSGFSNEIGGVIDCTPEIPPVEPPVELIPPVSETRQALAEPPAPVPPAPGPAVLAATGPDLGLVALGLGVIGLGVIGLALGRRPREHRADRLPPGASFGQYRDHHGA